MIEGDELPIVTIKGSIAWRRSIKPLCRFKAVEIQQFVAERSKQAA